MRTKTFIEIDYYELDQLIEKTYGHPFEIVADLELSNDSSKTVRFKKESLDKWDAEKVEEFKQGLHSHSTFSTYALMQDMVNNDVLPEGEYVIQVSW